MRLIDADYLAKFMAFVDYAEGLTAKQAIQLVKEADGIDAIPIAFLQEQQEKVTNDEAREIIDEIIARWEIERKEE